MGPCPCQPSAWVAWHLPGLPKPCAAATRGRKAWKAPAHIALQTLEAFRSVLTKSQNLWQNQSALAAAKATALGWRSDALHVTSSFQVSPLILPEAQGHCCPSRDSGEFCGVTGSGARLCHPHSPVFLGLLTTQLPTTGSQIPKNCCWILSCQLNSYRTKPQPPYYDFRGPQRRGQSRCPRRQRLCLGAQARGRPLHPHLNHTGWARAAPFLSPALGDLGPD